MIRWLAHRLRHPFHDTYRHGLYHPGLVCRTCDREWLPNPRWYRLLDR